MDNTVSLELGGKQLRIEAGRVAKQANGSVLLYCGDTVILATATMSRQAREGMDFFPLTCDYEERKYAVGKIPGGFVKRGGRPSEKAILTSRLIDRPLRPLFPDGMRNDVQVVAMPLSVDLSTAPDVLAVNAAAFALAVSDIPFDGPVACVRVIRKDGELIVNPSFEEMTQADMEIIAAGTRDTVNMLEAEASEASNEDVVAAIQLAHDNIIMLCDAQDELARKLGVAKAEPILSLPDPEIMDRIKKDFLSEISSALVDPDKAARESALDDLKKSIVERLADAYPERSADVGAAADKVIKKEVRRLILDENKRPDGRDADTIRALSSEVGLLPRVHGSGLFTRGQTQVLTALVLGSVDDAQIVDGIEEDTTKRYMHYYNFPPYSVGEVRPMRGPGRREIGHGALAEKALRPMIPDEETFPYSILLTSEVLESNGSTSMASTCASTLALMDAGVPIKKPVGGIAMGLMTDGDRYKILTDIQGMEDFSGDMDFKVAGTRDGVTAIQLDTKIRGLSMQQVAETIQKADTARQTVLDSIQSALPAPREEMSQYAPRALVVQINPEKIGEVIGPGGRNIKKIEADTGAKLAIEQDGRVFITSTDAAGGERAAKIVEDMTRELSVGETFTGTVVRTTNFGAFIELAGGKDGLLRIQEMSDHRIGRTEDALNVGDEVMVRIAEIDDMGRINLERRSLIAEGLAEPLVINPNAAPPSDRREERGDRGDRGGRDRGGDRGGRGGRSGGRGEDHRGNDRERGDRGGRERSDRGHKPDRPSRPSRPDHTQTSTRVDRPSGLADNEPRAPQARFRPKAS
ncbi:MAG: polyribonucleotide nucleotidyltransferase [Armatimonadetes bacterium]|nr:polyribonucleotide nucleotidyltransferase [Armatimonadota bacterium]